MSDAFALGLLMTIHVAILKRVLVRIADLLDQLVKERAK